MAGYVSINLHYEVTQTRLTFQMPSCHFVFVIPVYVNKGALLFCSALPQNLFRIRNLILPQALLALDQSAHLQISEQINTAVLQASAFFYSVQFAATSVQCSCHFTGRMGDEWVMRRCWHTCRSWQVCKAGRVSAPGVIYLISNPFWREAWALIFTKRFRASHLTGQKRQGQPLCERWVTKWTSFGLWTDEEQRDWDCCKTNWPNLNVHLTTDHNGGADKCSYTSVNYSLPFEQSYILCVSNDLNVGKK